MILRLKPISIIFLLFTVLYGCKRGVSIPPLHHDVKKNTFINIPFDKAWEKTIAWHAKKSINIENIDKDSGFIVGTVDAYGTIYSNIDCGEFNNDDVVVISRYKPVLKFNTHVKKENDGVIVNMRLVSKMRFKGKRYVCTSRGILEESLIYYIKSN